MPFRIIVVLAGAIGTAIAAAVYPFYGLLALVVLNFGRPQDDRPNVTALHVPMIILGSVIFGMLLRFNETAPAVLAALKRMRLILLLTILIALSVLVNYTEEAWGGLDEFVTLMVFCVITTAFLTTEKRLQAYIGMLLASGAYVMKTIIQNPKHIVEHTGGEQFVRVDMGSHLLFGGANYLGLYMVMLIFLSLSLLAYYKSIWIRLLLLGVVAAGGDVFFKANSRGASIALVVGLIAFWLTSQKKLRGILVGVVLIAAFVAFAPDSYWDRLQTIAHYKDDPSATGRLELWNIALDIIPSHPIFGVGFMNFNRYYAFNSQHQAYLQIASEVGLPALFVYITILGSGLYAAGRARRLSAPEQHGSAYIRAASQGIFCCIIAVTIQGFTTGLAHREVVHVFVCLSYCMLALAEQNAKQLTENEGTPEVPAVAELVR